MTVLRPPRRARLWGAPAVVLGVIATLLVLAAPASAQSDADEPRILPGPWVRAGRPVVVRVAGASRIRAASGPWALPQGAASDEFVLQVLRADLGLGDLEIEELSGAVRRAPLRAEVLPAADRLRAVLGIGDDTPSAADVAVDLSSPGLLPTIPEAWMLFDEVTGDDAAAAIPAPTRAALVAWRRRGSAARSPALDPLRLPPDEQAFRAAAEAAATAPRLPQDVTVALLVVAGATVLLLLVARGGSALRRPHALPPGAGLQASPADSVRAAHWRRIVWASVPSIACLGWFVIASPLPGAVRATSFVVCGEDGAAGFVRFETDVAAAVSFSVPDGASSAAVLAWDEGDVTVRDAEAGRRVRLALPASAVRVVAWRLPDRYSGDGNAEHTRPGGDGHGEARAESTLPPGGATLQWLRRLGLEPVPASAGEDVTGRHGTGRNGSAGEVAGGGGAFSEPTIVRAARGFRLIPAGAIRVATRK